jgi:hypothetical protein
MSRVTLAVLIIAALALLAGVAASQVEAATPPPKVAHAATTYPQRVASYVATSKYGGACGRGWLAKCERRHPPRITSCRLDGWCRFVDGYYQEWRNNASPIRPWKLWACRSNGYAHPGHGVAFTYKRCYKV